MRPTATPQDWRVAVREETSAAVKSVAAASGGAGDGLGSRSAGDGVGGGGGQGASSGNSNNNRLGDVDPRVCGARDKVRTCSKGCLFCPLLIFFGLVSLTAEHAATVR